MSTLALVNVCALVVGVLSALAVGWQLTKEVRREQEQEIRRPPPVNERRRFWLR